MPSSIQRQSNGSWLGDPNPQWTDGFLPGDLVVYMYLSSSAKTFTSISGLGATWNIVRASDPLCIAIGSSPQNGTAGNITDNIPQVDSGAGNAVFHLRGVTADVINAAITTGTVAVAGTGVAGPSHDLTMGQAKLVVGLNNLMMHAADTTPAVAQWMFGTSTGSNSWSVAPQSSTPVKPVLTRVSNGTGNVSFGALVLGVPTPTVPKLYLGSTKVDKLALGSTEVPTAFLGSSPIS